jgi:ornithine cyclodeaminase/alanine dehydrogenase-like protein (mu-crystallin family)
MTLLLNKKDVSDLLSIDDCIEAVERAFRLLGEGKVAAPAIAGVHTVGGGFHIKAGIIGDRFAAKVNANIANTVPRVKGVILLSDAHDGRPLAVMDSIEITTLRTGAATAVAAKYLARTDARTVLIAGCGNQGLIQLRALQRVRRIERVFAMDVDPAKAAAFAHVTGAEVVAAPLDADIVVTCTPSTQPILHHAAPGTFVAAVGADSEDKNELAPALMASSKVVTDLTAQCEHLGDLHHALASGARAYAELAEIVAGTKPGREHDAETIIFDSTGMALQDVAAAAIVYERAVAAGRGLSFTF